MSRSDTLTIYRSEHGWTPIAPGVKEMLIGIGNGSWRWRLTAGGNHRIIGASTEAYVKRADCIANAARVLDVPAEILTAAAGVDEPVLRYASLPPIRVVIRP